MVKLLEESFGEVSLYSVPIFKGVDRYALYFLTRFVHDGEQVKCVGIYK